MAVVDIPAPNQNKGILPSEKNDNFAVDGISKSSLRFMLTNGSDTLSLNTASDIIAYLKANGLPVAGSLVTVASSSGTNLQVDASDETTVIYDHTLTNDGALSIANIGAQECVVLLRFTASGAAQTLTIPSSISVSNVRPNSDDTTPLVIQSGETIELSLSIPASGTPKLKLLNVGEVVHGTDATDLQDQLIGRYANTYIEYNGDTLVGVWNYNSASTKADDGETCIVHTGSGARFIKTSNDVITPDIFGIKQDGVADATAELEAFDASSGIKLFDPSKTILFNGENLENIGNLKIEATIKNSIYSPVVLTDAGRSWLHHNHLEKDDSDLGSNLAITSGNIGFAPIASPKKLPVDPVAIWFNNFGLDVVRSWDTAPVSGGVGEGPGWLGWYYWTWLFHGATGDGYEAKRHPWLGYYRGDEPEVLDWICYWLVEAGVKAVVLQQAKEDTFRDVWTSRTERPYWVYQFLNNVPNAKALQYILWVVSSGTPTETQIGNSFDQVLATYLEYPHYYYLERDGKIYPFVYAFDAGVWTDVTGSVSATRTLLATQAAKFQAAGFGGFAVMCRVDDAELVGDDTLIKDGVIYHRAMFYPNYDASLNGGASLVDYEDLAIGHSMYMANRKMEYVIGGVSTDRDAHSAHPTTTSYPGSTPELFEQMCRHILKQMTEYKAPPILTIYNVAEHAEGGAGLIPNMRDGKGYLEALTRACADYKTPSRNTYRSSDLVVIDAATDNIPVADPYATTVRVKINYGWELTSTPHIVDANAYDGKEITLAVDGSSTNQGPLTLRDESVLTGSGLKCQGGNLRLMKNESIRLRYDGTQSLWIPIGTVGFGRFTKAFTADGTTVTNFLRINNVLSEEGEFEILFIIHDLTNTIHRFGKVRGLWVSAPPGNTTKEGCALETVVEARAGNSTAATLGTFTADTATYGQINISAIMGAIGGNPSITVTFEVRRISGNFNITAL